jgi:hypothetical protein
MWFKSNTGAVKSLKAKHTELIGLNAKSTSREYFSKRAARENNSNVGRRAGLLRQNLKDKTFFVRPVISQIPLE